MNYPLPAVFLARHGETAWSLSRQHTGLTDLPLTHHGELNAARLGERLQDHKFSRVFCSPLQRTRQTCELAGYADRAELDPDLVEWDYGEYEGMKTVDIRKECPGWQLFRDGCPGGESVEQIAARADRVVARLRALPTSDVLLFSSGHFLRSLTSRWLGLKITYGEFLHLSTATLSCLGYEHTLTEPVIRLWNDARHVIESPL